MVSTVFFSLFFFFPYWFTQNLLSTSPHFSKSSIEIYRLVVGPLGSKLKKALDKIATINQNHGPFELLLCAGDFFGPDQQQQQEDLEGILSGTITIPLPTYFMPGKHTLSPGIMNLISKTEGQLTNMLCFLGNQGTTVTAEKLALSVCGGAPFDPSQHSKRAAGVSTDILLSYAWPAQIQDQSPLAGVKLAGKPVSAGSTLSADLVLQTGPRYIFSAAEGLFFEREPFYVGGGIAHATRFIGLGAFGAANKERWFYAMNIVPAAVIDLELLKTRPGVLTSCPLVPSRSKPLAITSPKRQREADSVGSFFWTEGTPADARKKQRRHHVRECPDASHNRVDKDSHHTTNRRALLGPLSNRDDSQCWFCTSNEKLETHLILAVLEKSYISIAKGGLVPGHILVVPITHFTSTQAMHHADDEHEVDARETLAEMRLVQSRISDIESARDHSIVVFEIFGGENPGFPTQRLHHLHLQVVPVPNNQLEVIEDAFAKEASAQCLNCSDVLPENVTLPYMRVELPSGKVLVLSPNAERVAEWKAAQRTPGVRMPRLLDLQTGRRVLADILGMKDRADWKRCVLNIKEEEALAETLKPTFENFST
ncbi:hypothetical protein BASA83_001175 [Batrachochytrium salamandrivorans]|nr:hypothetical protein BASA83_001175 [Batrachochytrium salamandrivorans]